MNIKASFDAHYTLEGIRIGIGIGSEEGFNSEVGCLVGGRNRVGNVISMFFWLKSEGD